MATRDPGGEPLIVVGASVRALAASARRAGWSVFAADLFRDADLLAAATHAVRVPTGPDAPWPVGLEACLRGFPRAPWIYGGALENHPDLVDRIACDRPLAGNAGTVLRAVRDPARVASAARDAGLDFPDTLTDPAAAPVDGSFLVKPLAGAGGRGIARWHGGAAAGGGRVWQRFVAGRPVSVSFAIDAAGARLYGASRQLIGRGWCGARSFAWCGAVDLPVSSIPDALRGPLSNLGAALAHTFGLRGLVGVDLVVPARGVAQVLEVNPRPTASMELVERRTGRSLVATHLAACGIVGPDDGDEADASGPLVWAKAVVFTVGPLVVTDGVASRLAALAAAWASPDSTWPGLADLPATGTAIDAGRPALTVFAAARDPGASLRLLRGRVATVRAALAAARLSPRDAGEERRAPPPRGRTA